VTKLLIDFSDPTNPRAVIAARFLSYSNRTGTTLVLLDSSYEVSKPLTPNSPAGSPQTEFADAWDAHTCPSAIRATSNAAFGLASLSALVFIDLSRRGSERSPSSFIFIVAMLLILMAAPFSSRKSLLRLS